MNLGGNLPLLWNRQKQITIQNGDATIASTASASVPQIAIDYRDRISVITWLFVFGLGISRLYTLPTAVISLSALGSPMSIALTKTLVAAIFLAFFAAAGTESVISVHPRFVNKNQWQRLTQVWPFLALPMGIAIIGVYVLPLAPTRPAQIVIILVGGLLMAVALFSLYATVESTQAGFRRGRFVLDALAYGAALLLFLFVYQTRTRSLLSGTSVALTATLLAVEILRTTTNRPGVALSHALLIGAILGQVTWALNYWWTLSNLNGSLLLLLIFYIAVGIAQHGIQDHLSRRVLWEFAIFAMIALALIAVIGPRFG